MWFLALRNVILLRKRYMLMAFAIAAGFVFITVLTALSAGALNAVKNKAARYFSGQVSVIGLTGWKAHISNPDEIEQYIKNSGLNIQTVSKRTVFYAANVSIFFGGKYVRLKRPIGVDFEKEKQQLQKLPFIAGSLKSFENGEKNAIIIGKVIADTLKAAVGDDVILSVVTENGQYNTATLVVCGIFDEVNIFGYAAYLDIDKLNDLIRAPLSSATEIAVYTKNDVNITDFAEQLRQELQKKYPVFPPVLSRSQYTDIRGSVTEHPETLAVISIDAQLDEVSSLLQAFDIGTYCILAVFLLIITVGITNTFRVLIYDRIREIGTLRAMGMQKSQVRNLFLLEAFFLALFSSGAGFCAAFVILYGINMFTIQGIPIANMFTEGGKISFYISVKNVVLNAFFILITVFFAVVRPIQYACVISPAEALRQ